MPHQQFINLLREADASALVPYLQNKIQMETLTMEANKALGNEAECMLAKHRIADCKIYLLILSGDLSL